MVSPFLKWAGGKRWLVHSELLPIPNSFDRYVEPFLGSGAVFFHLSPKKALLSDLNGELINLYQVIKETPGPLWEKMVNHHGKHSKEYYYIVRSMDFECKIDRAARFLYLNRTCWNGLYRVNLKGKFNVPIGTKDTVVFDTDDFEAVSKKLSSAELVCSDFEVVIDKCKKGDFVFIDPPYTVKHNHNNFLKYNEKIFSWEDQLRLKSSVERAIMRGASVAVTNADHKCVRDLYSGLGRYIKLNRHSVLAGKSDRRGSTSEALFIANMSTPELIPNADSVIESAEKA